MERIRRIALVRGVVQGVGFRPTVYRHAIAWEICGWVRNRSDGLEIAVEGPPGAVEGFLRDLADHPPPHARVTGIDVQEEEPAGDRGFTILPSLSVPGRTLCPPDLATCDDCVRELFNPADRRFRYPFINCTNCGPRFTAVVRLPYDRPFTSMACFPMCPQCDAEYRDPLNRRYHAQPNACPVCGPHVWLADPQGTPMMAQDPIAELAARLRRGAVAAIKGIGGFHLAADATDDDAVNRLRARKGRDAKPLAVMVADLAWAGRCAVLGDGDADFLGSAARPILILDAADGSPLASSIAPGIGTVGIMLPYSPIHHLLFLADGMTLPPLVMTSGNLSDEPIATGNREALMRLVGCADVFLLHNRDIVARADDSVVQRSSIGRVFIRRSRGDVPEPIALPEDLPPSLGTGAFLKAIPCIVAGRQAFLGQHVGDLSTLESVEFHGRAIAALQNLMRITPVAIGCDLNPDFPSSLWARSQRDVRVEPVQHHYAHVVAAALEHGLVPPVLGLAIDGTGFGTDGSIWGCELLLADRTGFQRLGHLLPLALPGGDTAVHQPWRVAVGLLLAAYGQEAGDVLERVFPMVDGATMRAVLDATTRGINAPWHSSCGRLFDAVAALAGVCVTARFEAEAPMMLERLAGRTGYNRGRAAPFSVEVVSGRVLVLDPRMMAREIVESVLEGEPAARIAARFHDTMVEGLAALILKGAALTRVQHVVLTGGCMLNRYLAGGLVEELTRAGLRPVVPRHLPVGDGGVSLGQAAVAAWRSELVEPASSD